MVPQKVHAIIIGKKVQSNNPTSIILDGKHIKSDDSLAYRHWQQIKLWQAYF